MYVLQRHDWSPQRLFHMLEDCRLREKEIWRKNPLLHTSDQQTQIIPTHRDYAVTWMSHLNNRFGFYPETFFLAVNNLDRFLTTVKSHPKYLKCIAATCLYIASKIMEEEEHIPGALELVEVSQAGCRPGDIIRMEKIISSKLNWDFHIPTALTYMEIFYFLAFLDDITVAAAAPENGFTEKIYSLTKRLRALTEELQRVVCSYAIAPFRNATIALALLSLRADKLPEKADFQSIVGRLLKKMMIEQADLNRCRYVVETLLPSSLKNFTTLNNAVYVVSTPGGEQAIQTHQSAPTKRKANETGYSISSGSSVKKFHQNDENVVADEAITVLAQDLEPRQTTDTVKNAPGPISLCPPLEKLSNCNAKIAPNLNRLTRKPHLTYAEIVKLGTMSVCEE